MPTLPNVNKAGNSNKPNPTKLSEQNKPPNELIITPEAVNTAILRAHSANTMCELQQLVQAPIGNDTGSSWQYGRRKTRRFVVGRNEGSNQVQAVPKYAALHVTRLAPGTKPEQLKAFLEPNFPQVQCEMHQSKHPELYTSMKVTIRQEDFRNAWKREVWPNGALISKFFVKKRMLLASTDPQVQHPPAKIGEQTMQD